MTAPPVRILGIAGSLRRASHNGALIRAAAGQAPSSVEFDVFEHLDAVPVFNEDLTHSPPKAVVALRKSVADSDGLMIATPEYNRSVPGAVKNLIDWLSVSDPIADLSGMPVAVTGVTTGPWGTRIAQVTLQQMLVSVGALVMPAPNLFVPHGDDMFNKAGQLMDATTIERLGELVASLERWVRLVAAYQSA